MNEPALQLLQSSSPWALRQEAKGRTRLFAGGSPRRPAGSPRARAAPARLRRCRASLAAVGLSKWAKSLAGSIEFGTKDTRHPARGRRAWVSEESVDL